MERKYYQIGTKTEEDWSVVHELLMQDGTLEDNVPTRSIECVNEILHSPTRSTYLMTDEEAEILRNDPRINFVSLDPEYHPEAAIKCEPTILRNTGNVKNYRSLKNIYGLNDSSSPPTGPYDGRTSGEFRRTGYQILRCAQKNNPWPSDPHSVLDANVDYLYDGSDIDLVVADNGVFFGHPEFTSDEYDPPNYIRGNVLNRSGLCGVLDLVLDAPYYLDPDFFNASPSTRLERRWDGTLVPLGGVAREWWLSSSNRSESLLDFGSITIPSDYRRAENCGADRITKPSNNVGGYHGTPCASLAYGKNFGWAFNANKWSIGIDIGNTNSVPVLTYYNILKIFHRFKPNNPKFGTKNPTVSSNSWALTNTIDDFRPGLYSYQGGDVVNPGILGSVPFLRNRKGNSGEYSVFYNADGPDIVAGREMVDSGVIFICGAGNNGRYISHPSDPNFRNYFVYSAVGDASPTSTDIYVNRPGYPAQIGYRNGESEYKSFVIGAIDDEYTGAPSTEANNIPRSSFLYNEVTRDTRDPVYLAAGSGKERLARSGYTDPFISYANDSSYRNDYSNKGTGVDFYAPADGTLAASHIDNRSSASDTGTTTYQNPYQLVSSLDKGFNDTYMNGTSAACPVAAGLIACFMQNNRNLSALELKAYLKSNIENQTNFFTGIAPTSATDPNWHQVPYSTMGTPVKLIYQFTTTTRTPNPTFTPTYGISSSDRVNERFTINHSASNRNTLGIYGIQMFSSSIANGTSISLEIRTGYYLVGSANRITLAPDRSVIPARDGDGTTFGSLFDLAIRVDPTNNKKLQLSDSSGRDGWNDMEITVTNGTFQRFGTQIYYVFNASSLPSPPAAISTPPLAVSAGTPGYITAGSLNISGNITARGDIYGLMSDDRVKDNMQVIDNALEKLEKLNGFTYNFNETGEKIGFDPDQRHSGVSAQDVQEVLPEAVAPAPADNNYLTVKYDKLIPLLIESIKDLKNDLDDLKDSK